MGVASIGDILSSIKICKYKHFRHALQNKETTYLFLLCVYLVVLLLTTDIQCQQFRLLVNYIT
jgi:hypothetical protein